MRRTQPGGGSVGTEPLVVLAPDKFKGSLSAPEAVAALARGLRRAVPWVRLVEHPIADGGEGTVDMVLAHGFAPVAVEVRGPTGEPVTARYALKGDTAVVEMAAAAGLGLLPSGPDDDTARTATTYGVGELLRDALDRGARRIVLGIGGSATTDGGRGMAEALGVRLIGDQLDLSGLEPRVAETDVVVACDVDNPLTGPSGAAAVYGPQKGAGPETVTLLDRALGHWADLVATATGHDLRELPGAGAAGGLGFGAAALLGAEGRSGVELPLELSGFPEAGARPHPGDAGGGPPPRRDPPGQGAPRAGPP